MAFTTSIVGYGLLAWLPTIYRNVYRLPIRQNLQYSFVSYAVGLFGALFGMLLIDRFGRRPCYTVSFLGAGIPLLALWWLSRGTLAPVETVVTLASIALFFISILLAGIYVYLPEIYPTRMRAMGSGAASSWLRVASIVGPVIVGFILGKSGLADCVPVFWRRRCRRCTDRDDLRNRDQSQGSGRDRAMTCNGRPANSWSLAARNS